MIFDTHCHYNLNPLLSEWPQHWQKAQALGVEKSVIVGTDLSSCQHGLTIAQTDPQHLRASLAIHPTVYQEAIETQPMSDTQLSDLLELQISELKKMYQAKLVVAVGETGLDYFRLPADETQAVQVKHIQQQAFRRHLQLAEELNLPIIIHVRDYTDQAYQDVLDILHTEYHGHQPFILHCVSGPLSYVQQALKLGGYLGMAGNLTYKNAEHLRDLVRSAPPDRLLTETDAPFLPPQEFRGKTCEPWMISLTANFLHEELNLDLEQLYQNAEKIFGF